MSCNPLIEHLVQRHSLPLLDTKGADAFLTLQNHSVIGLFTDPMVYPENADVAVILPEILKAFPHIKGAIADPNALTILARNYGVVVFPALVFFQGTEVREVVARIHSWADYTARIQRLFDPAF